MGRASLSVVIHGHFYQPPREDPWLDLVPPEPSAAPWHDWNERVERECYRAVVASRLLDGAGRIRNVMNTLTRLSFDVGPTLLTWLERQAPATYRAILAADADSCKRLDGHGNAMAMPYHHPILPLSSPADRLTEVRWGIADFRRRFGRDPEGMWLPETAVDGETLDVLALEGILFTVLAPHQVTTTPPDGRAGWVRTPRGRDIAVFVYDGDTSHDVAFGDLLDDGIAWADRMVSRTGTDGGRDDGARETSLLRSMATDGETFGHHHAFGEMALAQALERLEAHHGVRVENFASFLARNPPELQLELVEPSSWSCAHGVERWRSNCGCRIAPAEDTDQSWRGPLREALSWLAEALHDRFEQEAGRVLTDPWTARDAYVDALGGGRESLEAFLDRWARHPLSSEQRVRAAELMELERNALRLFTSCAWFFDDVAGIEARQVLDYALRAVELANDQADVLREGLVARLSEARSNDAEVGSADRLIGEHWTAALPVPAAVAAAWALSTTLASDAADARTSWGAYTVSTEAQGVRITHDPTGRAWEASARVSGIALATMSIRVRVEGAEYVTDWDGLPGALRDLVTLAVVGSALDRDRLTPADFAGHRRDATLGAVRGSLREAVQSLDATPPGSRGPDRRITVHLERLLDALAALGEAPSFDTQTRLWRLCSGRPDLADILSPIRVRLGFAPADTSETP